MLEINGIRMPEPKLNGLKIKKEKIWSSNTGRTASAFMVGDLISIKYTLSIEWPVLTFEEAVLIDTEISKPYFSVKFQDVDGTYITKEFYAGTPVYPVYSYGCPKYVYSGTAVDLIER